jgi:hypothetical protein
MLVSLAGPVVALLGPKFKPLQRQQLQNAAATSGNKKMNNY